jgi:5-methylcytosine-specific restriction enzyme subunit McrC
MDNVLEVREFDTITCDERFIDSPYYRYLDERHFNQLEDFIKEYSSDNDEADILEFMKIRQYVMTSSL